MMTNRYTFDKRKQMERLQALLAIRDHAAREEATKRVQTEDAARAALESTPTGSLDDTLVSNPLDLTVPSAAVRADQEAATKVSVAVSQSDSADETPPRGLTTPSAAWQQHEPTDSYYAVPHALINGIAVDGTGDVTTDAPNGRLLGASLRGKMHAHEGRYREDSFHLRELANGWIALTVADGAGSRPYSRIGADLTTRRSVDGIEAYLQNTDDEDLRLPLTERLTAAVYSGVKEAYRALESFVAGEGSARSITLPDMACTLLIVLIVPEPVTVAAYQIGDGAIFLCESASDFGKVMVLTEADHGESAGLTTFITSNPVATWLARPVQVKALSGMPWLVGAISDGIADDFEFGDGVRANIGKFLLPTLTKRYPVLSKDIPIDQAQDLLLESISYDRAGSTDDRTIALFTVITQSESKSST